jgi:hypothetical protein
MRRQESVRLIRDGQPILVRVISWDILFHSLGSETRTSSSRGPLSIPYGAFGMAVRLTLMVLG